MLRFYLSKILGQTPMFVLLAASIVSARKRPSFTALLQCTGIGLLCLWICVDTLVTDPFFGLCRYRIMSIAPTWASIQQWVIACALWLFSVAYLVSVLRGDRAESA